MNYHSALFRILKSSVLIILWCLAGYILFRQGARYWDERWIQDDAYISFRYAKNLISGAGLVYNPGSYVEGYTNFSWVMLSAIPLLFGKIDPIFFMHRLSLGLWVGSYLLLLLIGLRSLAFAQWLSPLTLVLLSYNYSFNMWFFSGMEVSLVTFLFVALVATFIFLKEKAFVGVFTVLTTLTVMTRMDSVFFLAGLVLATILIHYKRDFKIPWRQILLSLTPLVVLLGIYFIWKIYYYGNIFPNTYYAKLGYRTFYARGLEYLTSLFAAYPYLAAGILGCFGLFEKRTSDFFRFSAYGIFATALTLFYVVRLGGDFMEWRFVTPLFGCIYLLAVGGFLVLVKFLCSICLRGEKSSKSVAWAVSVSCALAAIVYADRNKEALSERTFQYLMPGMESIPSLRKYAEPPFLWREVGKALKDVIPHDITYATSACGMIPFFSEHRVIDVLGLTDAEIAKKKIGYAGAERERVGHEFVEGDPEYLRSRGVTFIFDWPGLQPQPAVTAYSFPPQGEVEMVSVQVGSESWATLTSITANDTAIWRSLREDDRIEFYSERAKGVQSVPYSRVSTFVPNDTEWSDPRCLPIAAELNVTLPRPTRVSAMQLSLDHNDFYRVTLMSGERELFSQEIEPFPYPKNGGVKNRSILLPEPVLGVDRIRVVPHDEDWRYALCHLIIE